MVVRNDDQSRLHIGIAVIPRRTIGVVTVEVTDRFEISVLRSFLGAASSALPIELIAKTIRAILQGTDSKANPGIYRFVAIGTFQLGIYSVKAQVSVSLVLA